MNLNEAIEVLKSYNVVIDIGEVNQAIDTVVVELEKTTYTAQDMESFAEWVTENGWFYRSFFKVWEKRGYENKTTAQLREMWEIETAGKEATE